MCAQFDFPKRFPFVIHVHIYMCRCWHPWCQVSYNPIKCAFYCFWSIRCQLRVKCELLVAHLKHYFYSVPLLWSLVFLSQYTVRLLLFTETSNLFLFRLMLTSTKLLFWLLTETPRCVLNFTPCCFEGKISLCLCSWFNTDYTLCSVQHFSLL